MAESSDSGVEGEGERERGRDPVTSNPINTNKNDLLPNLQLLLTIVNILMKIFLLLCH